MNGLEQKYANDVTFVYLDAFSQDGFNKMNELGMRYHGYAMLDRWGRVFWISSGHNFTPEMLEGQIAAGLAIPPP